MMQVVQINPLSIWCWFPDQITCILHGSFGGFKFRVSEVGFELVIFGPVSLASCWLGYYCAIIGTNILQCILCRRAIQHQIWGKIEKIPSLRLIIKFLL